MRLRCRHGFTLAEVAAMLLVFSIFTTGLLACLTLSLRYYNKINDRVTAEQNSRIAMTTLTNEFRQSIIQSPNSGSILDPAPNATDSQLIFTEPSPTYVFGGTTADNFQTVRYFVSGGALQREVQRFSATGGVVSDTTATLVQAQNPPTGQPGITLSVTATAPMAASVTLTCIEGNFTYVVTCSTVSGVTF